MASTITIADTTIRMDKDTGFICVTDIGNAKDPGGGATHVANWLRNANTIDFIEAWEMRHNPSFNYVEFDIVKRQKGSNRFRISATELAEVGTSGILAKQGRYGGTYCAIDWSIHFANWLDPHFYVETIDLFRRMNDRLYGREELYERFNRELVAENYGLITQANSQRKIPRQPHLMTSNVKSGNKREQIINHLSQVDADIINLALWGLTAKQWRTKFPKLGKTKNMRDYATPVELKVLNVLQIIMRQLQEDQYSGEEKLHRLHEKAKEMVQFYCKSPEQLDQLNAHRKKRGW